MARIDRGVAIRFALPSSFGSPYHRGHRSLLEPSRGGWLGDRSHDGVECELRVLACAIRNGADHRNSPSPSRSARWTNEPAFARLPEHECTADLSQRQQEANKPC